MPIYGSPFDGYVIRSSFTGKGSAVLQTMYQEIADSFTGKVKDDKIRSVPFGTELAD